MGQDTCVVGPENRVRASQMPLFRSLELGGQRAVGRVSLDRRQEWERTGGGRNFIESVGPWGDDVRQERQPIQAANF